MTEIARHLNCQAEANRQRSERLSGDDFWSTKQYHWLTWAGGCTKARDRDSTVEGGLRL